MQKQVGRGLAVFHFCRAENMRAKQAVKAGFLQAKTDALMMRGGGDTSLIAKRLDEVCYTFNRLQALGKQGARLRP